MAEESMTDHATSALSGAAVMSPLWLPSLHNGAEYALPFLGCAWLLLQMYFKIKKELGPK